MTSPVGIDALGTYIPEYALDLADLASVRGVPVAKINVGLGAFEMAVAPPWEDTVSMGANAALRLIEAGVVDPDEIGLLLVGTETGVDHAKPVAIFLHELLGLRSGCRVVELKHACYAGTAGMMLATSWIRSGAARGRKALIVASDIARYDLESSAEFTQGAGAVAMVISERPRLLTLAPESGVFAGNVWDFWRPLERREALVDGKFSVDCYLDALEGALADWRANGGSEDDLLESMAALCFHTPFPKMAVKAHARLVEHEYTRLGHDMEALQAAVAASLERHTEPTLAAARRIGNTYTASVYLCLGWLAEHAAADLAGETIGLFSYGSGCCAEFFTGTFGSESAVMARQVGLAQQLEDRERLTVEEYEAFARAKTIDPPMDVAGIHLAAIEDNKRIYVRPEHRRLAAAGR